MTAFRVGQRYTRDQVRAELGLLPMTGGDWATGYARCDEEVFVFCNIGTAGRTGHDYPNRWSGAQLVWFGKTTSRIEQPLIRAMLDGVLTTHVFWRAQDRGPFVYAGVGVAEGAWGSEPVEVHWSFKAANEPKPATGPGKERMAFDAPAVSTFRHGPPPSIGVSQQLREDGPCKLYLMVLKGATEGMFPALSSIGADGQIVKVGFSNDPVRRASELNAGIPPGAVIRWALHTSVDFQSAAAAYEAEGRLLENLAIGGRWIGGEFAVIPVSELSGLLNRARPPRSVALARTTNGPRE